MRLFQLYFPARWIARLLYLAGFLTLVIFLVYAGNRSDIPLPIDSESSAALQGQVIALGRRGNAPVKKVTFRSGEIKETLQSGAIYLVEVPDDPAVPVMPLDHAIRSIGNGDHIVNYFGYKYSSADAAEEKAHRTDPDFQSRFPGHFFASATALAEDAQNGGTLAAFSARTGMVFQPTNNMGGALLEPGSQYMIVANDSFGDFIFNIRTQAVCSDGAVSSGEACDDGDTDSGDGCSATCTVESGWTCDTVNNPSICTQTNADLSLSTYFDPAAAQRGNNAVLHISVTNNGPSAAANTIVPLPAPTGLTFQTYDSTTDVSCAGGNCNFGTMSSETKSLTITYLVNAISPCSASATITANTSVSSDTTDSDSSNNQMQASMTATCPPSADLSTSVTASPQTALQGSDITITTTLTNNGPSTAVNPYFYLDVGGATEMNNIRIVSGCASFDTTASGIKCYVSNLASGANQTVVVLAAAAVRSTCTPGSASAHYVNIYPGSDTVDGNTANDHSSVTVTSTCPVPSPDLVLTASASPSSVERGNNTVLTFHVTNSGQGNAENTQLSYSVQSSLTYMSYTAPNGGTCTFSNNYLTCTFGTLYAGSGKDVNVTVLVPTISSCTASQNISVSANVTTTSTDPNTGNNYATTTIGATCPALETGNFSPVPNVNVGDILGTITSPSGTTLTPPSNILQTSASQALNIPMTVAMGAGPPPDTYRQFYRMVLLFSPELTFTGYDQGTGLQCMPYPTGSPIPGVIQCEKPFLQGDYGLNTTLHFTLPPICIADTYQMLVYTNSNLQISPRDYFRTVSCTPPQ